jgi:hypothetical protein
MSSDYFYYQIKITHINNIKRNGIKTLKMQEKNHKIRKK